MILADPGTEGASRAEQPYLLALSGFDRSGGTRCGVFDSSSADRWVVGWGACAPPRALLLMDISVG